MNVVINFSVDPAPLPTDHPSMEETNGFIQENIPAKETLEEKVENLNLPVIHLRFWKVSRLGGKDLAHRMLDHNQTEPEQISMEMKVEKKKKKKNNRYW